MDIIINKIYYDKKAMRTEGEVDIAALELTGFNESTQEPINIQIQLNPNSNFLLENIKYKLNLDF